ncbi:MAG: protein BatD [Archangium sp.]|nr:protein BatD [Archangium sp.]
MARTGSASLFGLVAVLALPAFAAAEPEVTMQADREKVGVEDTFRVDITVANAPQGATLNLPSSDDFEVLGRSQGSHMSYSVGPGGAGVVTYVQKHTLTLRANRTGKLTIPGAVLLTGSEKLATRPLVIEVVPGRIAQNDKRRAPPPNPFGLPPGFPGVPGFDDDAMSGIPDDLVPEVPRGDSDLFLRMTLDKNEAYVGEQVMLTIHLYSRIDLSTVDAVTMPKLDGFLSQDFKTPTQLMSEQRIISGVAYREYLLRQKAIFPLKSGSVVIEPAEADITTGLIFAGHKVHRKGNELKLTVRNLPPGPATTIVGRWRLSREISQTEISLGEPVQVKLTLEGRGNLQAVQLPPLNAPPSFKAFDPETSDKPSSSRSHVGGTRVIEYTLVPQQTGNFVLPSVSVPYFDPEARKYDEMRLDELAITVKPGVGGATIQMQPGVPTVTGDPGVKNQLIGGGLKSLRHTARFATPRPALSTQPWFVPLGAAPLLLTLLAGAFVFVRGSIGPETEDSIKKRQARAAKKRLAGAEKLLAKGSTGDFYAEVERALTSFMSARLGLAVAGLTRDELMLKLTAAGLSEVDRRRIGHVLETCDTGRYAPGMGEPAARQQAMDEATKAMEAWR